MDEPKPLGLLFNAKLFRVPDYQRGYAWGREQLDAFWEDLINVPSSRSHYTGVLTLKQVPSESVSEDAKEHWLVQDHAYKLYHIVDGQQRLTTFVVFLQAYIEFIRSLPENHGKPDSEIYVAGTLSAAMVQKKYLFELKPPEEQFRTYIFGYTDDNPSYEFMRYRVLGEIGEGTIQETFYTLNLSNAKRFFLEQLHKWHQQEGVPGLQSLYRTLTKQFLFNEYIIKDEFDVFVAFETMNNRGKKLSSLELLKNRLIYLTTLYTDEELDPAGRANLRNLINEAWKEVYHQLGRNKSKPLNDDDFLRAHWIMYFKYSRKKGNDYIHYLLDEEFTPKRVHKKIVQPVELEETEEQSVEQQDDVEQVEQEVEELGLEESTAAEPIKSAALQPNQIRDYVLSLKASSVYWFASFYPELAGNLAQQECEWLQRLNRLGMAYFRPLVMAVLKSKEDALQRARVLREMERLIFILFRLTKLRSNYLSSVFNNMVRQVDRNELTLSEVADELRERTESATNEDSSLWIDDFYNLLSKKFDEGTGYYSWSALRYFLYEYELSLLSETRQKKVSWSDLLTTPKDRISIEHIYPQSEPATWKPAFKGIRKKVRENYRNSLGNLLLLSSAINSSLQNDSFAEKKKPKIGRDGQKLRNGYSDGSHSEIEVAQCRDWGPEEIHDRGLRLLRFMEKRWDFQFADDDARESLLFIEAPGGSDEEAE